MSLIIEETVPLSERDCFLICSRRKEEFTFPLHIHVACELNFIENGRGARRVMGDSTEEIGDVDLTLITSPCLEHGWFTHNCQSAAIREVTIQFHRSLFGEQLLQKNQFQSVSVLLERAKHGVTFSQETIAQIKPKINELDAEPASAYSVFKLMSILYMLSVAPMRELSQHSYLKAGHI